MPSPRSQFMLTSLKTATPTVRNAVIFTALAVLSFILELVWLFVLLQEGDGHLFFLTFYVGFALFATILSVTASRRGEWRRSGGGKRLLLTLYGSPMVMALLTAAWVLSLDMAVTYAPVIDNHDDWLRGSRSERVYPEHLALFSTAALRKQYATQSNHFRGMLSVNCKDGTKQSVISFQRTLLCNSASNTFLIAEGRGLTNAVAKPSFEDVLQEVFVGLKQEAANPSLKPKKFYTFVLEEIRKWWSED